MVIQSVGHLLELLVIKVVKRKLLMLQDLLLNLQEKLLWMLELLKLKYSLKD